MFWGVGCPPSDSRPNVLPVVPEWKGPLKPSIGAAGESALLKNGGSCFSNDVCFEVFDLEDLLNRAFQNP